MRECLRPQQPPDDLRLDDPPPKVVDEDAEVAVRPRAPVEPPARGAMPQL
jgi:hypothetical protein